MVDVVAKGEGNLGRDRRGDAARQCSTEIKNDVMPDLRGMGAYGRHLPTLPIKRASIPLYGHICSRRAPQGFIFYTCYRMSVQDVYRCYTTWILHRVREQREVHHPRPARRPPFISSVLILCEQM